MLITPHFHIREYYKLQKVLSTILVCVNIETLLIYSLKLL
jgi:hypothetical protein